MSPATNHGRQLIEVNFKMHHNWIGAAGPSVDAQVSPPVRRYLKAAKLNQGWRPSLEQRHHKKLQDQWMENLVRDAKPGVVTELSEQVVRYKDYRKKNRTGGVSLVEQYENAQLKKHHHTRLRNMKPATDTSAPANAMKVADFMASNRFTRGGTDKWRKSTTDLELQSMPRPGSSMEKRFGVKVPSTRNRSQAARTHGQRPSTTDAICKSHHQQLPERRPQTESPDSEGFNLPITLAFQEPEQEELLQELPK